MNKSKAETVEEYLNELPADKRKVIAEMRALIRENLPAGYVERMNWGMISYEVPLRSFSETYNRQPLTYLMLTAQKNHNSLYMMGVYGDPELEAKLIKAFEQSGKHMNMGKSCLRFKTLDDLPIETIAELIACTTVDDMIAIHNRIHKAE
ncbi:MAG: DUF1801 domain-containing protein [Anaerolineales bacterium]|jgi:uncharacterized protein YdhG (YjbR/CyaY superfamily)